jgi:ribosomal protein S18 acetylase RimI-like enzyme
MMDDLVLREATAADVPAIVAVLHAAFREYDGWLDPPSGVHRETVASIGERMKLAHVALALVGGEVVGCVMYHAEHDHVYFGRLAVLPAHRGRGVGGALIVYVEERARELGRRRVRLGVRIALTELRAPYERMGYRLYEERRHAGYTEPTYVLLEKALPAAVEGKQA